MMKSLPDYSLTELKLIYNLLHAQIAQQPALMDSALLSDLQTYLMQAAKQAGVDVSLHADWSAWLQT